jgi:hypothetical protein
MRFSVFMRAVAFGQEKPSEFNAQATTTISSGHRAYLARGVRVHRRRWATESSGTGDDFCSVLCMAGSEVRDDQPGLPIHCDCGVQLLRQGCMPWMGTTS